MKIGLKYFTNRKCLVLIPTIRLYYFKGYKQHNNKFYPNEYIIGFEFLIFTIELWSNKFWEGFFKINKTN
jgi:hypothetical protein